jgi:drug/metabolite transporter (DMT)-like permease
MPISAHYLLTVLIWGLTWTAIRLQVEAAAVDLSVFYRFVLAAAFALVVLKLSRRLPGLSLRQHGWLLLQGLTLYSVNFLLIYRAAETMTTGLLAVIFSLASLFNAFNGWVLMGQRPSARIVPAVALGMTGVALLFWQDVSQGNATLAAILFALGGTYWFSLGNLVSLRVRGADIPLLAGNAWAMSYGALALGIWCLSQGVLWGQAIEWTLPASGSFWGATLFLAIPGSIVAFYSYITVIRTLGAAKAGYATVLFPVVALSVSTWLEGFIWTGTAIGGAALALLGNFVLFYRKRG